MTNCFCILVSNLEVHEQKCSNSTRKGILETGQGGSMNYQKMVQQIFKGSRNINKMKEDVIYLVSMVFGLLGEIPEIGEGLPKLNGESEKIRYVVPIGNTKYCSWSMETIEKKPTVTCVVRLTYDDRKIKGCNNWITAYVSGYTVNQIPSNYIQDVFDGLPSFIEGMISRYPYLERRLKPFIRASGIRF